MNIVVTGASSGIGYECVRVLAQDVNNRVVAIARRAERLIGLKQLCFREYGNNITIVSADLSTLKTFESDQLALPSIDCIDILINNAADVMKKTFEETEEKDWEHLFNTNFFSVVRIIKYFLPKLKQSDEGAHIVNISSMAGYPSARKFPILAAYTVTKAAVCSLTELLAEEFRQYRIRCNAICPGAVQTDMLAKIFPHADGAVTPDQIAKFIVHFALYEKNLMNGQMIPVSRSNY
ncbi:MAG: SDR family oxidoreductase [Phycisphaerales bacterium]|nr:SDR family oxidoreductase [Phycisphaerales bacterium]